MTIRDKTAAEIATEFGYNVQSIRRLAREKVIPYNFTRSRTYLFSSEEVETALRERYQQWTDGHDQQMDGEIDDFVDDSDEDQDETDDGDDFSDLDWGV